MKTTILALAMAGGAWSAQGTEPQPARSPEASSTEASRTGPSNNGAPGTTQPAALHWGHLDPDGLIDVLAVAPDGSARLLRNAGDSTFEDVSDARLDAPLSGVHGACFGDYDADGLGDLFVARPAGGQLLRQARDGHLVDVSATCGLSSVGCEGARWLDFDGDGVLDLSVGSAQGERLFRGTGTHFEPVASAAGRAHLAPLVDGSGLVPEGEAPATARDGSSAGRGGGDARPPVDVAGSTDELGSGPEACAPSVRDAATGACVQASSLPAFGALYPLGPEFNVDAAGNVGIGTLPSGARLEVDLAQDEVARLGRASGPSEVQLSNGRLRSSASRFQILGRNQSGTPRTITFGQGDGDYDVTLTTSGDLGIGTSTPGAKLDVDGAMNATSGLQVDGLVTADRLALTTSAAAPLSVASAAKVVGLHVGQLDGFSATAFSQLGALVNTNEIANDAVTSPKLGHGLALTGDLTVDGGVLQVDASSNSVGVGESPTRKLSVAADIEASDDAFVTDDLDVGGNGYFAGFAVQGFEYVDGEGIFSSLGPNGLYNSLLTTIAGSGGNDGGVSTRDQNGNTQASVIVNSSGDGVVRGDVKNFVADNPDDPSTQIWYASLEGPEAAAYARGTALLIEGEATIELPRHFQNVAAEEGLTVILSSSSVTSRGLAAVDKTRERIVVREMFAGTGNYAFDWEVKAVRRGFEDFQPVRSADWGRTSAPAPALALPEER